MSATTPEQKAELVREGFGSYVAGDLDGVEILFAPEIETYAPPEAGNSGTFRGADGWRQWITQWLDAWDRFEVRVRSVEPVGERHVVAVVDQTGVGRGSGAEVDLTVGYLYEIPERHATFQAVYMDPDTAFAVARRREGAEPEAR
jgi:ketosteroid isomerase-like protein